MGSVQGYWIRVGYLLGSIWRQFSVSCVWSCDLGHAIEGLCERTKYVPQL